MRSLEQVNIRTNVRTYVRTYSHTYVRDRPYIPSTTLLCEGIINFPFVPNEKFITFRCPKIKVDDNLIIMCLNIGTPKKQ